MTPSEPDNGTSKRRRAAKRNIAPREAPDNGTRSEASSDTSVRPNSVTQGSTEPRNHGTTKPRKPREPSKSPPHRPTKKTPEALEKIIQIMGVGGTWNMAAAAGGISPDTLKRWRDKDPAFASRIARARDDGTQKLADRIRQEAESGDWRAASWLLERIAPDQYGRRAIVVGSNGGPVQIEGELRIAAGIRASEEATAKMHEALLAAAAAASERKELAKAHE